MFGRLQLLQLLGKSERTMAWRVVDTRNARELILVLPRVQPEPGLPLQAWQDAAGQAARLKHPNLAAVVEVGVQDGWPFVAYDNADSATVDERLGGKGLPGVEAAELMRQTLRGLAYAHEAGVAHHDLQSFLLLTSASGALCVAGLAVACDMAVSAGAAQQTPGDPVGALQLQRLAAERDVLAAGLLLHGLCTGTPALDEPDTGRVIDRLPPRGRDTVRLPWSTPLPIPEVLRAIANRASDRQERQRYHSARTLLGALEGWLQTESLAGGGPMALLLDRVQASGVLPSMPGGAVRAARLATMERERTNELAEVVLQDPALAFEMLRLVNSAQVRSMQAAGGGAVLTIRRAIAMLGLAGVRRAAQALRPWPGPLDAAGAAELQREVERCKRAARLALTLRPASYDGEVVYLLTLLQNLGRLVVHYHFANEAQQIRRLMLPGSSARAGEAEDPGMPEETASFTVLGVDIEAIGAAITQHWGLDDAVMGMLRRLPLATPIRALVDDASTLRAVASCANETLDAVSQPATKVQAALLRVVHRYGRVLNLSLRDLQDALQATPLDAAPVGRQAAREDRGPKGPATLASQAGAEGAQLLPRADAGATS